MKDPWKISCHPFASSNIFLNKSLKQTPISSVYVDVFPLLQVSKFQNRSIGFYPLIVFSNYSNDESNPQKIHPVNLLQFVFYPSKLYIPYCYPYFTLFTIIVLDFLSI